MSDLQWQSLYQAALLETDITKLHERINAAEAAIQKRYQSPDLDQAEVHALEDAMRSLSCLREET